MIPASFQVGAVTVSVHILPAEEWIKLDGKAEHCGMYLHEQQIIYIRGDLPDEMKQQTFCHELVHCILTFMGSDKNSDEAHVDLFATFLQQILVTMQTGSSRKRKKP